MSREKNADQLRRIAQTAIDENKRLAKVIAAMGAELDSLRGDTGATQEALDFLEQLRRKEAGAPAKPKGKRGQKKRKSRTEHGPTSQPQLEVVTETCTLDEADQVCPSCGGELQTFEGQYDESEMVDVVEVSYRLVQLRRQKYVCGCGGCVETAPGPERAVKGGRYSLEFATKVAVDKYLDHLPLERQVRIMKRHGLQVTSQTLWKQLDVLGAELGPTHDALRAKILAESVIGLDQTSWKRLSKKKSTPYQMWCLTTSSRDGSGAVYHTIRDDKSRATFDDIIGDFQGTIVCDAMSTHKAAARGSPNIELAACWAHVHRKFQEVDGEHPGAERVLTWIRKLYELDAQAQTLEELATIRDTRSRKVLAELRQWLGNLEVLRSTAFGSAARYTFDNWANLIRFADNPKIPLDNNATERGIRGPVVGRKNHYGSKSARGTQVAALFYSLLETAKLNNEDPAAYLRQAVLAARRGEVLLPFS